MGASESTESIKNVDKTTVQNYIDELHDELNKLKSELASTKTELETKKRQLLRTNEIEQRNKTLLFEISNLKTNLLHKLEKSVSIEEQNAIQQPLIELQQKYNTLETNFLQIQTELEHHERVNHSLVSELNELSALRNTFTETYEGYERNKEEQEKKYNELNDEHTKVQLELKLYKANECTVKFSVLEQELLNCHSQIEVINMKRNTHDEELKTKILEYDQRKDNLHKHKILYSTNLFDSAMDKYNDIYTENDKKIKHIMEKLDEIEVCSKALSEQLARDANTTCSYFDEVLKIIVEYLKVLDDLQKNLFFNDYQQEEKLYADLLNVIDEQKLHQDNILEPVAEADMNQMDHLQNRVSNIIKGTEDITLQEQAHSEYLPRGGARGRRGVYRGALSKRNPLPERINYNSTSNNCNIIIYNFPDLMENDNEVNDTFHVRYFLSRFEIGALNNITVQRLPSIPRNETVRPVVVTLPNIEAVDRVMASINRIKMQINQPNLRIARYNERIGFH